MSTERPVLTRCPLCGGTRFTERFLHAGTPIVRCDDCTLEMRNPQPSDEELAAIYGDHYFIDRDGDSGFSAETGQLKQDTAKLYLDEIETHLGVDQATRKGLRLLEVGPGFGYLLGEAAARGYDARGLEYSESSVRVANQRLGRPLVQCGSVDETLPTAAFDIIVMADVIEHTRDPLADLRHARRALRPGGLLFLATPSLDSWSAGLLGRRWVEYKVEHLFYFSKATMQKSLATAGFERVTITPCRKVLNFQYVSGHFDRFPVPILSSAMRLVRTVLPAAVRRRNVTLVASGMNVFSWKVASQVRNA